MKQPLSCLISWSFEFVRIGGAAFVLAMLLWPQLAASTDQCVTSRPRITFSSEPLCPAASWSSRPAFQLAPGDTSPAACLWLCAASSTCSAVHFSPSAHACWLATRDQWQDAWLAASSSSDQLCKSLLKSPTPPQASGLSASLKLWYNFRYSLTNLANTDSYPAQLVNAIRNASGAILRGSGGSYVQILVPEGLQTMVGAGSKFTYFIKAERDYKAATYYMRAADSSGASAALYEDSRNILFGNALVKGSAYQTSQITEPSHSIVSIGVSHFGNTNFLVMYNNSFFAYTLTTLAFSAISSGADVRLGYKHGDDTKSLSGRIMCFGVWNRSLSQSELQSLQLEC